MCLYVSIYVCICLFHLLPCILTSYLKLLLTVNLFALSPGTSSRFHSTISIRCLDLISLFGIGVEETCLPPDVHVKCTPNLTLNWTPNLTAWLASQVGLVSLLLATCEHQAHWFYSSRLPLTSPYTRGPAWMETSAQLMMSVRTLTQVAGPTPCAWTSHNLAYLISVQLWMGGLKCALLI